MNYELSELVKKRRHSEIYKKQNNGLARSRDADG
jgi:uncharacterized membrane-anchored protein